MISISQKIIFILNFYLDRVGANEKRSGGESGQQERKDTEREDKKEKTKNISHDLCFVLMWLCSYSSLREKISVFSSCCPTAPSIKRKKKKEKKFSLSLSLSFSNSA